MNLQLNAEEEVVAEFKPSTRARDFWIFLLTIWMFPFNILVVMWVRRAISTKTRWVVTNRRLIEHRGRFNQAGESVPLSAVTGVSIDRPFLSSLLRSGKVRVTTSTGSVEIYNQSNPSRVVDTLRGAY